MPRTPPHLKENENLYRSIFDAVIMGLIVIDLETGRVIEANPAACQMHGYSREGFIDLQWNVFIHPGDQDAFNEALQAFQLEGMLDTQMLHLRADGSTFAAGWRGAAFTYQDRPCLLGIVRDVSKRTREEQLLRQRLEITTHEQAKLLEISHILASSLEFQPGLILDQLQEIVAYTQGGLFALEDSTLVTRAMRGTPQLEQSAPLHIHLPPIKKGEKDSLGQETLDVLFGGRRPIRIADVGSDEPPALFLRSLLDNEAAVLLAGMQSWMWVPLAVRGSLIGGLGIAAADKDYFTAHHADMAHKVANMAALAMTNAELYQHAQALAILEERQRLARELHDAINQSLFSAGLIAEVLPRLWERDQAEARTSLEDLRRLMRGAQAEMRALLAELRPATLTDSSLADLLRLLGNAFSGRTNIPVAMNVAEDLSLPADVQVAFYRVCQEALNNIAKHARASQVEISLKQAGDLVEMHIRDDGQGFDPAHTLSGHYGLSMMSERAAAVGAQWAVASQPGQGAELTLRWTTPPAKESA
jgi:PAS domain S-box-containing protein